MPLTPEEEKNYRQEIREKLQAREERDKYEQDHHDKERQKQLENRIRAKIKEDEEEKFYTEKGYIKYRNRHGEIEWITPAEADQRKKRRKKKKSSRYSRRNKILRRRLLNTLLLLGTGVIFIVVYKFLPINTDRFGSLIVLTDIPGAEIYLNAEKIKSFAPDTLNHIKTGNYYVTVSKEGFNSYPPVRKISVSSGETKTAGFRLRAFMKMGKVKISANVKNYQLYVDGIPCYIGRNEVVQISQGYHTIMLIKKGYLSNPSFTRVFVKPDDTISVSFDLIANSKIGYIKVSNNLSEGLVFFGKKSTGMQANGELLPIIPGLYEVRVLKNGFRCKPDSQLIHIKEGETRLVVFRLEPDETFYPVSIRSSISGAAINIDGKFIPLVTPIQGLKLTAGSHYVTLIHGEQILKEFEKFIEVSPMHANEFYFSF